MSLTAEQTDRIRDLLAIGLSYRATAAVAGLDFGQVVSTYAVRRVAGTVATRSGGLPRLDMSCTGNPNWGQRRDREREAQHRTERLRRELEDAEADSERLDKLAGALQRGSHLLERENLELREKLAVAEKDADAAWRRVDELNGCQPEWSEYAA